MAVSEKKNPACYGNTDKIRGYHKDGKAGETGLVWQTGAGAVHISGKRTAEIREPGLADEAKRQEIRI